jgi:hypothetical protein
MWMVLRFSPLLSPEEEEAEEEQAREEALNAQNRCTKGVSLESVTFPDGSRLGWIEIDVPRGKKKWNSGRICALYWNKHPSLRNGQKCIRYIR